MSNEVGMIAFPEARRRVFYIDTGPLSGQSLERVQAYLAEIRAQIQSRAVDNDPKTV